MIRKMKQFVEIKTVDEFKEFVKTSVVREVYFAPREEFSNIRSVEELEKKVENGFIVKKDISEYDLSRVDDSRIIYFSSDNQIFLCVVKE